MRQTRIAARISQLLAVLAAFAITLVLSVGATAPLRAQGASGPTATSAAATIYSHDARSASTTTAGNVRGAALHSLAPSTHVRHLVTPARASVLAAKGASAVAAEARQVTVLGRYTGGVDAYVGKPGFNALDLPLKVGTGRWNWTRNKRFIDDAIERGDEIRLVTNPNAPMYQGGNTFQRELRYLKDRGYTWQQQGDYWNAVPR